MRKNKLTAGFLVIFLFISTNTAWASFSDITKGFWAEEYIEVLSARDIIAGYSGNVFSPEKNLTRAEAAVLMVKAAGYIKNVEELKGTKCIFRDIKPGHWAAPYITLAWEKGLVSGYADGTFRPDVKITRAELSAMAIRALEGIPVTMKYTTFKDQKDIPVWAVNCINKAVSYGLISGYPEGTFKPNNYVNRAETSVIFTEMMKEKGFCYDFHGKVLEVKSSSLLLNINDKEWDIPLSENAVFNTKNGLSNNKSDLQAGIEVLCILNDDGQIAYVENAEGYNFPVISTVYAKGASSQTTKTQNVAELFIDNLAPYDGTGAAKSTSIVLESMGVNKLHEKGKTGQGEIVAVIDTGIDPGLNFLREFSAESKKLVDFLDVTNEGLIQTAGSVAKINGAVSVDGSKYSVGGVYTLSGNLHYGYLTENSKAFDFNGNNSISDKFLVLIADSKEKGVYDSIYIDTDNDKKFEDEKPLYTWSSKKEYYSFPALNINNKLNFLVSEIAATGTYVKLGYDLNGHGTMMAAAAVGTGTFKGAAPDSKLLVVKAFDIKGESDWSTLEKAIKVAVQKGATVVNMSLGYKDYITSGNNSLTYLAEKYYNLYGTIFVASAGNYGPGLATLATPGNGDRIISTTSYIPKKFANDILSIPATEDTLWAYASAGPRKDGDVSITGAAPGIAVLPLPEWNDKQYALAEGSSISSAYTAGGMASFMSGLDTARRIKLNVIDGLGETCIRNTEWGYFEAGNGKINFVNLLGWHDSTGNLEIYTWHKEFNFGKGIYAREYIPGFMPFYCVSPIVGENLVYLETDVPWMSTDANILLLPKNVKREVGVRFSVPEEPGIYTGNIISKLVSDERKVAKGHVLVIVPYKLENGVTQKISGSQYGGERKRYYFEIGENTNNFQGTFENNSKGILQFTIFDPNGNFIVDSGEISSDSSIINFNIDDPAAGTWEIVVNSPLDSLLKTNQALDYDIQALISKNRNYAAQEDGMYFIGNITRNSMTGQKSPVSLCVRDKWFKPVNNQMIEINNKLYQIKDGWISADMYLDQEILLNLEY